MPVPEVVPRQGRRARVPDWHESLDGVLVKYEGEYEAPGARAGSFVNWCLRCPLPGHHNCMKKRHVSILSTAQHGDVEPLAYLHAWIPCAPGPGRSHATARPSQAQVDAVVAERGDELRAIVARIAR